MTEEQDYHREPALSASGAKLLLPPHCPAVYRYTMDNPPQTKAAFDLGHGAHTLVLGVGKPIVEVEAADWRTKAAKEQRDEIHAAGSTPLLTADYKTVHAMADKLREHRLASALLSDGQAEQVFRWTDALTGAALRARLDWLPNVRDGRRLVIPDYKTAGSASPEKFSKVLHDFGYDMQAAWYREAVVQAELDPDPAFVFIVQETKAPFIVSIFQPDAEVLRIGKYRNRQAINIFAQCTERGEWPAYTTDIDSISVPPWVARQYEETAA